MNFISELKWRGMIQDITPGTEEKLSKEMVAGYIGFDPSAPSLHIGNLATIMLLVHFQRCGHKPIALVGGATGMIGDPSGKSDERNLLSVDIIRHNQKKIQSQLEKFLDFKREKNAAEIVNNYDWFEGVNFLDFLRDVGKHLSVNYMLAKDSVKQRLERGLSFTEFSYQLMQAYDFYWLYKNKGCTLQMGGSDQWGNITTGTELIRRKASGEAFALTAPLITRSDKFKFGKSEGGNIWLDPEITSPYKFYQYWLNCSDEDAANYIKRFTLLPEEEVKELVYEHNQAPHTRVLQKKLAEDISIRVHSLSNYQQAIEASEILFGKGTTESLKKFSEKELLEIFEGVPQYDISKTEVDKGINILELLANKTNIFPSRGEARRMIQGKGVSINKEKISDTEVVISSKHLLNKRFILIQKGKKNYFLLKV